MDFKEYLQLNAREIEKEEDFILKKWRDEIKDINKGLLYLVDEFIKSNKGGKKIRGVLVKLGYEIARYHLGGVMASQAQPATIRGEITKVSAAYEILHTSILAHDDIMDQDLQRRRQPSLYQVLGGNHYGISQAISLADAGFFLSVKVITESGFGEKIKIQALQLFAKITVDTALGQMLDVNLGERGKGKGESDGNIVQVVNLLKTARYTISGPLRLGAILAGVSHPGGVKAHLRGEQLLGNLTEFGENLGIAFQIKDDILDEEITSPRSAKRKAQEYINKSKIIIPRLTKDKRMSKLLEQMADYLVERNK